MTDSTWIVATPNKIAETVAIINFEFGLNSLNIKYPKIKTSKVFKMCKITLWKWKIHGSISLSSELGASPLAFCPLFLIDSFLLIW